MDFILNQSRSGKWQEGKLDGGCKAPGIGNVVSLANLFSGTLAKSIDEFSPGIVPVQTKIVSKVNYPAFLRNLVRINELP